MINRIKGVPLSVSREKVYKRLNRGGKAVDHSTFDRIFDDVYSEALSLADVQAAWLKMNIENLDSGKIILSGEKNEKTELFSKDLASWLTGCGEIYILALTVGRAIADKIQDLSDSGEVTRALLMDAVSSELVEAAADALTRRIAREANAPITKRYSPGYGDWKIDAQRMIDDILCLGEIGIELNDAYLMIPEKSITAVIGVKKG
ncbi:MAG: hypothetical protein JW737_00110 [Acidobacteria bacterium]|nr:hypothetical protein [Acidobacteriota bacterium]